MTYEQAKADHEYLWENYGPAYDMTGAYIDQEDLGKLLKNPTKKTARECYETQIVYWFQAGVQDLGYNEWTEEAKILASDGLVVIVPEYNGSYPGILKQNLKYALSRLAF